MWVQDRRFFKNISYLCIIMKAFNFKYISFWGLLFVCMAVFLSACHHDEPTPEPEPGTNKPAVASRTVLVYMVASNDMGTGKYDDKDLNEMMEAAVNGDLNDGRLIVYHVPYHSAPVLKEITKDGVDTLKIYEEDVVSVKISQMRTVIEDTKDLAPADDYGLVLWSHGLGWLQDGIADVDDTQIENGMLRSFGRDYGNKMNITALESALDGQGFSFIYFDCCYMGSVEVVYQLRNCASVLVAGPTEDPIDGMPYNLTMKHFFTKDADMVAAAKANFDFHMGSYVKASCPVSMVVVNTDGLEKLARITGDIYAVAETPMPEGYSPQQFSATRTCYYFDLQDYVKAVCHDSALLADWQEAFDEVIEYEAHSPWIWGQIEMSRCGGLSTYILKDRESITIKGYNELKWFEDVASKIVE